VGELLPAGRNKACPLLFLFLIYQLYVHEDEERERSEGVSSVMLLMYSWSGEQRGSYNLHIPDGSSDASLRVFCRR
jgi:hypothetical protein